MFRTTGSAWQQLVVSTVACWTITTNGTRSPNSTKLLFSQVAACAYICEMTHGYENEVVPLIGIHLTNPFVFQKFHDLIHCMLDNGALEQYPQVSRIHEIHTPTNNRMDRAKARILTLWQMCKLWMTSRGTGEMPMSVREVWNKVLDTGGCSGESTVESRPIPVAMTGTHANMNDSYNRWNDYKKWKTKEIKMNWIKNNV